MNRTNAEWLLDLGAEGQRQGEAISDLRDLLLRGARYTLSRQLGILEQSNPEQVDQLAEDCAQDSLVEVLKHLSDFRGDSKFTTWAYKFAINISLTTARKKHWRGVSLDQLLEDSDRMDGALASSADFNPDLLTLRKEVSEVIRDTLHNDLTIRQRQVIQLMVFDEVPMDVVVEYLGSNRNAVYKLLHDARRTLKKHLEYHGFGMHETMDLFAEQE